MKNKRLIIEILSLLIFLVCAGAIAFYGASSRKAQSDISALQDAVEERTREDTARDGEGREKEIITYAENGMMNKYYPLYEQNNDMVGWLRIEGTRIDYPVMYTNDGNEFYMRHNFKKEAQYSGLPFMDYECDMNNSSNLIIYGHNMKDGSMFAELLNYKNKSFYDEHGSVSFDSLYETWNYKIIAAFYVTKKSGFRYYEFINALNREEYDGFIENVKALALYDTGESAEYGEKLLTLSTCSYNTNDERFVVVAKRTD